ncbi:hypothetical protein BJX66DRAFT_62085 [Aspergillus keveii]|uniref:Epidermal growth factor receptor-like transmembrane-juxtamembrane segment domain-containing protein n=1 Tax=Aspergillus keveii TaxID=714993 RepID=A0ABR4GG79_9EURO
MVGIVGVLVAAVPIALSIWIYIRRRRGQRAHEIDGNIEGHTLPAQNHQASSSIVDPITAPSDIEAASMPSKASTFPMSSTMELQPGVVSSART